MTGPVPAPKERGLALGPSPALRCGASSAAPLQPGPVGLGRIRGADGQEIMGSFRSSPAEVLLQTHPFT